MIGITESQYGSLRTQASKDCTLNIIHFRSLVCAYSQTIRKVSLGVQAYKSGIVLDHKLLDVT